MQDTKTSVGTHRFDGTPSGVHKGVSQLTSTVDQVWDREKIKFKTKCVAVMTEIMRSFLDDRHLSIAYGVTPEDIQYFAESILDTTLSMDIDRLVASDPATKVAVTSSRDYVFDAYKGIHAITYYRIANALIYDNKLVDSDPVYRDYLDSEPTDSAVGDQDDYFLTVARLMSERAAVLTTIEINPSARIGGGFVIDHGINAKIGGQSSEDSTVVGETCEIGENCTILNGVTLGASEVNTGQSYIHRRHPRLGDGVTVCGGARVLGGITIGDNAWIGPNCVVTHDVPEGCKVTIINQLQYERSGEGDAERRVLVYGIVPRDGTLSLHGEGLSGAGLSIADRYTGPLSNVDIVIESADDGCIKFDLVMTAEYCYSESATLEISSGSRRIYLMDAPALRRALSLDNRDEGVAG